MLSLTRPGLLLRLEGAAVFLFATALFAGRGDSWLWYLALILAPDLSALGYVLNPRIGSVLYNIVHTYALPAGLAGAALLLGNDPALAAALIWAAHIGADRALGFGLKYPDAFKDTHLNHV
jgi:hypothetical protein